MKNMRMLGEKGNRNRTTNILIGIIILLVLFIAYFFVVVPAINKVIYKKQVNVVNNLYGDMIKQLKTTGAYQVRIGNKTIVLVPYVPQKTQGTNSSK